MLEACRGKEGVVTVVSVAGRNTKVTMAIVFIVLLSWAARRAMYLESSAIWRLTLLSRWATRLKTWFGSARFSGVRGQINVVSCLYF